MPIKFSVTSTSSTTTLSVGDCDFDSGFCQYENPEFEYGEGFIRKKYKWERITGKMGQMSLIPSPTHIQADHNSESGNIGFLTTIFIQRHLILVPWLSYSFACSMLSISFILRGGVKKHKPTESMKANSI